MNLIIRVFFVWINFLEFMAGTNSLQNSFSGSLFPQFQYFYVLELWI